LRILIKKKEFLQATFKYFGATDIAKNWPLGDDQCMQNIRQSLRYLLDPTGYENSQVGQFVPPSEWGNALNRPDQAGADDHLLGIQKGSLATTTHEFNLDVDFYTKKPRLRRSKLDVRNEEEVAVDLHDRVKQVPLDNTANFLQALGVTNEQGKPKQAMASKLRQCQKFVEIVASLVDRVSPSGSNPSKISVQDLGCGRGYLTFSLHAYLKDKYNSVDSVGIDLRPKLVNEINSIASSLGTGFERLTFQQGTIEDVLRPSNNEGGCSDVETSPDSLDVLIALHACDTATDDALWCGISRKADIIVVAPCCHKEVRPQLNAHLSRKNESSRHPLADMLQHNVYRERHSEMVTDSLRALLLELAGYQVQVFEFVGGEHTAKNVMITAVRSSATGQQSLSPKLVNNLRERVHELVSLHGIQRQKLAQWMGVPFLGEDSTLLHQTTTSASKGTRISRGAMPPL
jgi:SAM-dependent methyltransferase